ncbi:MAG TPA: glycosyltransferase [Rhodanobacteraceae bacterium]|nr:glycosyltransferase [Rhodanobacteraceae bacterium]
MADLTTQPLPRIAVLLPNLAGGGAERVALMLAGAFVRAGVAVDLVLGRAQGELLGEVPAGVNTVDLDVGRLRSLVPAFVHYLRRARPDTVLAVMQEVNCAAVLANMRATSWHGRVVLSEHSNPVAHMRSLPNLRGRWFARRFVRTLYPRADGLIAISQGVADAVIGIVGARHCDITVINNPVDATTIRARSSEPVDHPWLKDGGDPVLMAVGNLKPAKDYPTLLRAFALLRRSHRTRLVILGEGDERNRLRSLVKKLGIGDTVVMPGFVHNPWAWMAKANLCVLSSRWEGFALVVAEALALGVPVVSTDCPSGPREILEDGRYGTLVPVGDPPALARAMEAALDRRVDAEALRRRAADFAPDTIARRYLDVLLPPD